MPLKLISANDVGSSSGLEEVLARIAASEKRVGRAPGSVTLIAVSKTKPIDSVLAAARCGVMHFGENYVQEATRKMDRMKQIAPELDLQWHLIGSLQTNKSKFVVGRFKTIQSVDRLELARALDNRAREAGIVQNIFMQVKLGDEPSKMGVPVVGAPELIKKIIGLKNIRLDGLMSLPPVEAEPESSRKYFAQLRVLRDELAPLVPHDCGSLTHLSMGTTHDFEIAIEEGATMVRVGTAIFGTR
jgi:pyridoxal phosphate enzyme (YggS family)